jgi:hypothetical protein
MLVHEHLIVRAQIQHPPKSPSEALSFIKALLDRLGLVFLCPPIAAYCEDKGNRGVTALAAVNASHVALHTWDESTPAILQLDVYSCKHVDPLAVLEVMKPMVIVSAEYKLFDRSSGFAEITERRLATASG